MSKIPEITIHTTRHIIKAKSRKIPYTYVVEPIDPDRPYEDYFNDKETQAIWERDCILYLLY